MAGAHRQALLEKKYYETCPGCKLDKLKQVRHGVPLKELFSIWMIMLCTALPMSSLFPYLYYMVRDFHIAETEEDIGYYAGFIGASFMFGRALTSIFWGIVADRYGRKPIILIGTTSVVIFNTLFGLSVNLWMAIATRFLLGSMNGLFGPIKAYATEVFCEEYQALGMSAISTAWGIGLIIGPALGGFLSQPAEKYPHIFSKESLFGRFPYLLPCLIISTFSLGVTIACFWLPETLHIHNEDTSYEDTEAAENGGSETATRESLMKNWPLMSSIIVYCVFSLHDMAYTEIFSLWAVSPRKFGGLSFSTTDVGEILTISGLGLFLFQSSLYPYFERLLGPINLTRLIGILTIALLSSYPFMGALSGFSLTFWICCASTVKNVLCVSAITSLFILQNKAVDQHQRGAANGLVLTTVSVFQAAGPAGAGILFSWAEKRQDAAYLPGSQMIFFVLCMIEAVAVLFTFKPFLVERQ